MSPSLLGKVSVGSVGVVATAVGDSVPGPMLGKQLDPGGHACIIGVEVVGIACPIVKSSNEGLATFGWQLDELSVEGLIVVG